MGEWLRRLASSVALRADKPAVVEHLLPGGQLGVGVPVGCEAAARALQAHAELLPDTCTVEIDLAEAFQRFCRAALFRALSSNPRFARLQHLAVTLYGRVSDVVFHLGDGTPIVTSCCKGTVQGCVTGSFFCIAIADILEWLRGRAAFVVSISDDIVFRAPVQDIPGILTDLRVRFAAVGESVNLTKCKLLHAAGRLPAALRAQFVGPRGERHWADASTPPNDQGFIFVGIPFGSSDYVRAQLDAAVQGARNDLERVASCLSVNRTVGLSLIRRCILPRFTYLMRCLPPAATAAPASTFDKLVVSAISTLFGTDINTPEAIGKLGLLPSEGGYGVAPRARLTAAAFVAGYLDTRAVLSTTHPEVMGALPPLAELGDGAEPEEGSLAALAADALQQLRAASEAAYTQAMELSEPPPAAPQPAAPAATPTPYAKLQRRHRHVQSLLSEPLHKEAHAAFLESIDACDRAVAQHKSESGNLGTAWLDACTGGATAIDTEEARINLIISLALPLVEAVSLQCPTCDAALEPDSAAQHLLLCDNNKPARHSELGSALLLIATALPDVEDVLAEPVGIYTTPPSPA